MKNLSTKQKIISLILCLILLGGFIWVGSRDYVIKENDEHKIFSNEYPKVSSDNVFKYANSNKVFSTINSGDGIIFFCFKQNDFCGYYASILNTVAIESGIKKILYYDFFEDRKNNNATYESMVEYLKSYLIKDDLGKVDLSAPSLLVIKNNNIIYYDDETSRTSFYVTPKSYWTSYNAGIKKATLETMFQKYLEVSNGK